MRLDAFPHDYGMTPEAGPAPEAKAPTPGTGAARAPVQKPATADSGSSIVMLIAQLGALKEKGMLTEEEFAGKKAELLSRL